MRRAFLCYRHETDRAVEACRFQGVGPQADDKKTTARIGKQALDQDGGCATAASSPQYVDMPQATDVIRLSIRVAVDTAHTDKHTVLVNTKQRFPRTIEAICAIQPLGMETVEKWEALVASLLEEGIEARGLRGD
ncbi:MAG TPA: hypothetical protein VIM98_02845 [Dyella sp.]